MTNNATSQATHEAAPHFTAPRAGAAYDTAGTMDRNAGGPADPAADCQARIHALAGLEQGMWTRLPAHVGVTSACPADPSTEGSDGTARSLRCTSSLHASISRQQADWLVEAIAARQDRPELQDVPEQIWTASPVLGGTRLQCWHNLAAMPQPLPGDRRAVGLPLLTVTILGSEARLDQGLVLGLDRRAIPAVLSLHPRQ